MKRPSRSSDPYCDVVLPAYFVRLGLLTWQIALAVVLTTAAAVALTYAAGRIFRTGLLMQGKGATLGEMWRWVRAG